MQCEAKSKRSGKRCRNDAMKSTNVCRMHGGKAPQVQKAAGVRAARVAAEAEAQRMVARAGVDADPIEHLLESLYRAAALVEVWGAMVAAIDQEAEENAAERDEVRGELSYAEETSERSPYELRVRSQDRLLALDRHGQAGVHPYVTEYQSALERRAKFAKLCIDAGIAERQVRIAEEQGQLIAKAIRGILEDLGVADNKETPGVVRKHLQLVAAN
jgi:hypothetical protein